MATTPIPDVPSTPAPPAPTIRTLESPSVAWAAHENQLMQEGRSTRKEEAKPHSGEVLGCPVVAGVVQVDEARTMRIERAGNYEEVPLWHLFVETLHFKDITPADQPPVFPLRGYRPWRGKPEANPTPTRPATRIVRVPADAE